MSGTPSAGHRAAVSRRALLGLPLLALAGCAVAKDPASSRWHQGELAVGTGNPTGVFYEVGAAYAAVINRHLSGYDAVAAPTNGSVDNLKRLGTGNVDIGLVFADNAADALHGTGPFAGQAQQLRALARIYNNYAHVIVRTDRDIASVADMRGKRISTSTHNSGTEVMANRMLSAVGLNPDRDVVKLPMSLGQTTDALAAGTIDGMFWSGGLPTPGVGDLFREASGHVQFLPVDGLIPALTKLYGAGIYTGAVLPKATYGLTADVRTVAEPNMMVVDQTMPEGLAYQLTGLLFQYQSELAKVHPVANDIKRDTAPETDPVPLHPGAARFYQRG
ncbi:TAXI family TRAP transporter solute-binding subunit [Rugosimonospora africana]|uniref:C4-dicarboxylate ABC transporter substrate-binding protein n=1 Tax=Rugosimonospora africana TaxID=556532 RepID=A0A8J3QQE4_9ACTN|nr:TAXI family TRAP transporter solute-binding subunit [Rugosimonospora africana]GIH13882.1 C4-dicarboxylate ABC transporter substrate-binding protein [Rugosimonospora africana]